MSARHRFGRMAATALASIAAIAVAVACTPADGTPQYERHRPADTGPPPKGEPAQLATDAARQSSGVIADGGADAPYNYGPTVMLDGGKTRMWWCSQLGSAKPPGDDVLYAEAETVNGPFDAPGVGKSQPVLSGNPGGFDGMHTCDPSTIKVGDTYYLYYTGAEGDHDFGNQIGLATSKNGIDWERANDGRPIVSPSGDRPVRKSYGAGQPAALYLDGWFYLMFTDTTGAAAGWNGAGQFVLRAKDPTFQDGVQALGRDGFADTASGSERRDRAIVDAFSADWMWVEQLDAFAIAHQTDGGTTLTFWDREFTRNPYEQVLIPGPWREGPGLVRQPDGHAPVSAANPCGTVPVDVVRATTNKDAPTGLRHFGLDITDAPGCATAERALRVLDGFAVLSPKRTIDLVINEQLLRVERRSVAEELASKIVEKHIPALDDAPVAGRLTPGTPAKYAEGRGVGFLLDDGMLWQVRPASVVELNSSPVGEVSPTVWDAYAKGPAILR
ncbi:hypothetical protein EV191_11466 [Tamaricihabitans halophyticus]|uniref:Beta-xylosidase n=1 Tax=Tamaricihabitans halophyticus TaxID=1262583 RepID=A0A4R2QCF4_9PSEU|nr:beta-xylosidase [Tamaricihabitans halophyticus]TCP46269.1 hypothetical protein EV191_11466 [Tamaricihabitans halophyticus]